MERFRGRVALVTGAGRGIGRAVARRLAAEGAAVLAADLDAALADDTARAIRDRGGRALAQVADVRRQADCAAMVRAAVAEWGALHVAVCNAGVIQVKQALEITEADWDGLFAVNVKGAFFTAQAAGRQMLAQRQADAGAPRGRIVMMASIAGRPGAGPMAAAMPHYRASKAAVISMTQSLAQAFAPHATVNAVCPGVVGTDMWAQIDREWGGMQGLPGGEALRQRQSGTLIDRPETPEDVAALVAFIASDEAEMMTGQAVNLDGGMVFS